MEEKRTGVEKKPSSDLPRYARLLRQARNGKSWSRQNLVDTIQALDGDKSNQKLGLDVNTVGRWEHGKTFPSPIYRQRLIQVYEKTAEELGLIEEDKDENAPESTSLPTSDETSPLPPAIGANETLDIPEEAILLEAPSSSFVERGEPSSPTSSGIQPDKKFALSRRSILMVLVGGIAATAGAAAFDLLLNRRPAASIQTLLKTESLFICQGHNAEVTSVACSPNGKFIVSGSEDFTLKLWDATTGKMVGSFDKFPDGHQDKVITVAWSPDGNFIASGSWDHTVKIWYATTQTLLTTYHVPRATSSVAWSYDSRYIAVGCEGKKSSERGVQVWNVMTGKNIFPLTLYRLDTKNVHTVAWAPKTPGRIAFGTDEDYVYIVDVDLQKEISRYTGHRDQVNTVAWSPNGNYIASGSGPYDLGPISDLKKDLSVRVWNVANAEQVATYKGHKDSVLSVSWSPCGKYIASASADKTVHIWDAMTGQPISIYMGHSSDVESVSWSPDGRYIVSGSFDKTVHIWKVISLPTDC